MTARDLSPDAPHAHRTLALVWPYLLRVANRVSLRVGMPAEDILHHFALHILQNADEFQPAAHNPTAFAWTWCRQVLGNRFFFRWRAMSRWAPIAFAAATRDRGEIDPTAPAEFADDVANVQRALGRLSARRRRAVELRAGLHAEPLAGVELGNALGVRPTTGNELVLNGLQDLARMVGADSARAGFGKREGGQLGQAAAERRRAIAARG